MTVYAPHETPSVYVAGDVFMIQHGPRVPNVFAWEVLAVDEKGFATNTKLITDLKPYEADIERFVRYDTENP